MRSILIMVLAALLTTAAVLAEEAPKIEPAKDESPKVEPSKMGNPQDRLGYSLGWNYGKKLKAQGIEVNYEYLIKGINDSLAGAAPLLTEQEIQEVLTAFQAEEQKKLADRRSEIKETNKKEGEDFLAQNKTKEGVVTLPSGLQYKIITEGSGKPPKATDTVTVNYRGTLINGTEFDSSYSRNEPTTFQVKGVIPGWTEALQLMKPGAKWQLFVPPILAYGERGSGRAIPPNSTLIFEVELLKIE